MCITTCKNILRHPENNWPCRDWRYRVCLPYFLRTGLKQNYKRRTEISAAFLWLHFWVSFIVQLRLIQKTSHYHAILKLTFQFLRETCEGGRERTKERRSTASHCLPAAAKGDATLPCYIHPQRSLFIFQPWVFLKTIRHHGCSSSYMKFKDTKVKKRSTRRYMILRNISANLPPRFWSFRGDVHT